ncbi:MAG TPA: HAD hydrolase-like protein [Candidatus Angelobacter sp.]|jgi:putative hydrolase of the HAD superfamily
MLPQTLLIDADDTLWENNVYFDQAIADFIERLNHQHLSAQEVRSFLYEVEKETIIERGYGSHSFSHSLVKCFERLSQKPVTPELHEFIWGFAHKVSNYPIQLIEGVPETLDYLAGRGHHLLVMTKGDIAEQYGKVERSGIKEYFAAVEIVVEKNTDCYRNVIVKYGFEAQSTWMVGNSPKSDINPALEAGINAVFIPHDMTWALEHETVNPVPESVRLLEVERFADLRQHF